MQQLVRLCECVFERKKNEKREKCKQFMRLAQKEHALVSVSHHLRDELVRVSTVELYLRVEKDHATSPVDRRD